LSDYKNSKWAKQIIDWQKDDGGWGYFHSLSIPASGKAIATENSEGYYYGFVGSVLKPH
jgi:hypothetical protein